MSSLLKLEKLSFAYGDLRVLWDVDLEVRQGEIVTVVGSNGAGKSTTLRNISRLVKPGVNRLSVAVTSTWFNRLVYDAGQEEKSRKTWTISGPAKGRALLPTGLLGPVVLRIGMVCGQAEPLVPSGRAHQP